MRPSAAPASRFSPIFSRVISKARCGRSGAKGGHPRFLLRHAFMGEGEGQPGLVAFWREGEEGGAGPFAKILVRSGRTDCRAAAARHRRCLFFRCRQSEDLREVRGHRAHQAGRGARPHRREAVRVLLDRRLSHVRDEAGSKSDRFSPQPVLHAAGRDGARWPKRIRWTILAYQYDIVCNGVELSTARSATTGRRSCTRPSRSRAMARKWWSTGSAACCNAFKFGAPPHGGIAPGHRPDRHAAGRGTEHPRGHRLPHEPGAQDLMMGARRKPARTQGAAHKARFAEKIISAANRLVQSGAALSIGDDAQASPAAE